MSPMAKCLLKPAGDCAMYLEVSKFYEFAFDKLVINLLLCCCLFCFFFFLSDMIS